MNDSSVFDNGRGDTPPSVARFIPGPWRECGHKRGGCTCGQVWSIPADVPVATAIIGEWGDTVAVLKKEGRRKVAALDMMVYGSIGQETGKANARLIAAAPQLYEALVQLLKCCETSFTGWPATLGEVEVRDRARAALQKAVPQTVAGTPTEAPNTESYPNKTTGPV